MRMDLNFLGCGSAFNPLYGNTSAYFTNKDQLYAVSYTHLTLPTN